MTAATPTHERLRKRIIQVVGPSPTWGPGKLGILLTRIGAEVLKDAVGNGLTAFQLFMLLKEAGLATSRRSVERYLPKVIRQRVPRSAQVKKQGQTQEIAPDTTDNYADPFAATTAVMASKYAPLPPLNNFDEIESRARIDNFQGARKKQKTGNKI